MGWRIEWASPARGGIWPVPRPCCDYAPCRSMVTGTPTGPSTRRSTRSETTRNSGVEGEFTRAAPAWHSERRPRRSPRSAGSAHGGRTRRGPRVAPPQPGGQKGGPDDALLSRLSACIERGLALVAPVRAALIPYVELL